MTKITKCVMAMCGWTLLVPNAFAQFPGGAFGRGPTPFSRPTVSPYLNLLQSGNPAINYYGLVRPQLQFQRALQNLGDNVNTLGNNVNALDTNQTPQTGHKGSFMTQGMYFMTNGSAASNNGYGARPGVGFGQNPGQYSGGAYGGMGAGQTGAPRAPTASGVRR